MTVNVG